MGSPDVINRWFLVGAGMALQDACKETKGLVDGAPAARFLQRIKRLIESPYLLLG